MICKIEWNDKFTDTYFKNYMDWQYELLDTIQIIFLSQHAKTWYSHENIVLLSVVLTWRLGTSIQAKKRMPN